MDDPSSTETAERMRPPWRFDGPAIFGAAAVGGLAYLSKTTAPGTSVGLPWPELWLEVAKVAGLAWLVYRVAQGRLEAHGLDRALSEHVAWLLTCLVLALFAGAAPPAESHAAANVEPPLAALRGAALAAATGTLALVLLRNGGRWASILRVGWDQLAQAGGGVDNGGAKGMDEAGGDGRQGVNRALVHEDWPAALGAWTATLAAGGWRFIADFPPSLASLSSHLAVAGLVTALVWFSYRTLQGLLQMVRLRGAFGAHAAWLLAWTLWLGWLLSLHLLHHQETRWSELLTTLVGPALAGGAVGHWGFVRLLGPLRRSSAPPPADTMPQAASPT